MILRKRGRTIYKKCLALSLALDESTNIQENPQFTVSVSYVSAAAVRKEKS
jgi:hypothetical protein